MTRRRFAQALPLLLLVPACAHATSSPPAPSRFALRAGDDTLVLDGRVRAVHDVRDPERDGRALSVELDDRGRDQVRVFTSRHVGERIAIAVDGRDVMTPTVRDPLDGPIRLTAPTDAEVDDMRRALR